jgi:hypothetical protein
MCVALSDSCRGYSPHIKRRGGTVPTESLEWQEITNDPHFPEVTYWYVRSGDMYIGVMPQTDGSFGWFVGQGRQGDADNDPMVLKTGEQTNAEDARIEAARWYSVTGRYVVRRS